VPRPETQSSAPSGLAALIWPANLLAAALGIWFVAHSTVAVLELFDFERSLLAQFAAPDILLGVLATTVFAALLATSNARARRSALDAGGSAFTGSCGSPCRWRSSTPCSRACATSTTSSRPGRRCWAVWLRNQRTDPRRPDPGELVVSPLVRLVAAGALAAAALFLISPGGAALKERRPLVARRLSSADELHCKPLLVGVSLDLDLAAGGSVGARTTGDRDDERALVRLAGGREQPLNCDLALL